MTEGINYIRPETFILNGDDITPKGAEKSYSFNV